ncbi:MAG TPA: carbohydrate kinase family protein [Aggregatilineales bacterium]|nr:carbohydrate kinase family protein [Aggregatilineales bacterium]
MSPSFDVLSYGTIGLDYILRVPYWPTPDRGVHVREEEEHLGGKATNTAVLLAGWGRKVAISGYVIGDDPVGTRLLELLGECENLSTRYLEQRPGLSSMYCRILVNPAGERAIIGVKADETPQTEPTREMIEDARLLALDLYGGAERVRAARLAADAGRPVVIGDLRRADHPVLPYTTVAIASAAEIRAEYPGWSMDAFAGAVRAAGAPHVIVTDGSGDVLVFADDALPVAITPPQVEVVDATGAGDAFRAGVVLGLLEGAPLTEAAALGAAAGSINVTRAGGASRVPELAEVRSLAASLPRRQAR